MTVFKRDIPGFPEQCSDFIELPDIAELLTMPMFNNISPEDLRKYGTNFQKTLLDKTPLLNNTKYISIKSFVQFLYPGIGACDIKIDAKFENEWHIDYDGDNDNYAWHILTSQCSSRTEFNINPVKIECESKDLRKYLNEEADSLNLVGKKIDSNKIITFKDHIHRPAPPERPEFRYFWRVQETSYKQPEAIDKARMFTKNSFNGMTVHKNGVNIKNLEHNKDGIMIYFPFGGK